MYAHFVPGFSRVHKVSNISILYKRKPGQEECLCCPAYAKFLFNKYIFRFIALVCLYFAVITWQRRQLKYTN